MKNLSYAVSAALFIVWMSRKGNVPPAQQSYANSRWGLFFKALSNELVLTGTRTGAGSSSTTGNAIVSGGVGVAGNPATVGLATSQINAAGTAPATTAQQLLGAQVQG